MHGATLFIEQFRDIRKPVTIIMQSSEPLQIENLNTSLSLTRQSLCLQTVAIWKIKLKPDIQWKQEAISDTGLSSTEKFAQPLSVTGGAEQSQTKLVQ